MASNSKGSIIRGPAAPEPIEVKLAEEVAAYVHIVGARTQTGRSNASKVDPLPHQIEAVYGYILKLPRIRFLPSPTTREPARPSWPVSSSRSSSFAV